MAQHNLLQIIQDLSKKLLILMDILYTLTEPLYDKIYSQFLFLLYWKEVTTLCCCGAVAYNGKLAIGIVIFLDGDYCPVEAANLWWILVGTTK